MPDFITTLRDADVAHTKVGLLNSKEIHTAIEIDTHQEHLGQSYEENTDNSSKTYTKNH